MEFKSLENETEEISAANLIELERRYKSAAIIISAQIAVAIILTLIIWVVAPASASSVSQQTITTLWIAIIFLAIGTFALRRTFFRWDRLKDITLLKGISGLLATLRTNAIILSAMAEMIAIVGFIIAFLSGEKMEMVRAAIVALIVFLINFPRKNVWKKIAAGMEKV